MTETAILVALLVEIALLVWFEFRDSRRQEEISAQLLKILGEQKEVLEESGQELADISDALVEEKDE